MHSFLVIFTKIQATVFRTVEHNNKLHKLSILVRSINISAKLQYFHPYGTSEQTQVKTRGTWSLSHSYDDNVNLAKLTPLLVQAKEVEVHRPNKHTYQV